MASVAFIGLGNMGLPMALNLTKAGHSVNGWDVAEASRREAKAAGVRLAKGLAACVAEADAILTMLPSGPIVREAYLEPGGVLAAAPAGALLIDCSTIDVASARAVAEAAAGQGLDMLDAPVSGGVAGAQAGRLTFMVGGSPAAFVAGEGLLGCMGRTIVHAGAPGAGQAAKICNNMMLGISMIGTCEAFCLADGLGLDRGKLFEIAAASSGQSWSLTAYCPVPGPLPQSPANSGYKPGFAAAMMLKDLKLAQDAAGHAGVATALGALAAEQYAAFCESGNGGVDFSGIFKMIADKPGVNPG